MSLKYKYGGGSGSKKTGNAMQGDSRYKGSGGYYYNQNVSTEQLIKDAKAEREMRSHNNTGNAAYIKGNNGYYDFSRYAGNTNGYYNGMTRAGYTYNGNGGSNFSLGHTPNYWNPGDAASFKKDDVSGGGYGGIGYKGLSRIGEFKPSQAYLDAMSYTQGLLDKINSGRTSYTDKINEMMDKISNRKAFNYDSDKDPLFQNALASAMSSGQTAMQDTIGQASALTGGYGSSYATSAGNQAYNEFVKGAYEQLPEFYKLALDAYTREGDEMYRQLGMYNDADDKEYGRLTTAYGLNYQQAQDMYGHEYNNYWDTANYNYNVDRYNADAAMEAAKFNAQQKLNYDKFEYEKQQNALANASKYGSSSTASVSDTEIKNMKSDLKTMAERYGGNSSKIDEYIQLMEQKYGRLPDSVISELYMYVDSNSPAEKLTLTNKNGNYVYTNQYGKPYQGADRTLVKTKSASNSSNDEYTDAYGNKYTQ